MKVELVGYSQMVNGHSDPMALAELAASVCYDGKPTERCGIVRQCIASGHMSVLEHVSFTFHIEGISRACLAQLSRHRHISLSVRSQRYCREDNFQFVNPFILGKFNEFMEEARSHYVDMVNSGAAPEDARAVLPNACCTELYMTANARALVEMSHLRMCNRAQREIRAMFKKIRNCLQHVSPFVAQNMIPACEAHGGISFCTEHNSCGRHPRLSDIVIQQEDVDDNLLDEDDDDEEYFD